MGDSATRERESCSNITMSEYWNEWAQKCSEDVVDALADERHGVWETALARALEGVLVEAVMFGHTPRIADLGCGPGFFSALLAEMDCEVDAVDISPDMIELAKRNVALAAPDSIVRFHTCSLFSLPFESNTFDACVSRDSVWLMRDPKAAYAEWLRVLRPGGKLIVFDANWHGYLADVLQGAGQLDDMPEVRNLEAQALATEHKHCADIVAALPLTSALRPQWDVDTLAELGVKWVHADVDVWRQLWTRKEQERYASSPLFVIEAVK
ncbi:MAG: class I SAM-dependent methyltransferase [Eggerthellaceae bacterium]|nr:class I SAM-dependent methyltransferase [Eggerthellaceae bacterium]